MKTVVVTGSAQGAQVAGLSGDVSSEALVQQLAQWIADASWESLRVSTRQRG